MVTDQNPGSSQRSTRPESKKSKRQKQRARKRKKLKSNGKSNDPEVLKVAMAELRRLLTLREEECLDLKSELSQSQEGLKELGMRLSEKDQELREQKAQGLGPREEVKLRNLQQFHGRVVNAQMKCEDDKKNLDKLVEDFQYILGKELKPHI